MSNRELRPGREYWDRLCNLPRYMFLLRPSGSGVQKLEDSTGNWIDVYEAQRIVDEAQQEIRDLREELAQCLAMAQMVEEHEWAEHVGKGPVSSRVEAAFTQMHNDLSAAQEAPGAVADEPMASAPAFALRAIKKLKRFRDCAEDGQGADIGREWFDVLVLLGLLNRVQRSPALWEITDEGDALLDDQAAPGRSAVIPEGYALVPKEMHLSSENVETVAFHCGDGEEGQYGDFTDGRLWIGEIVGDDGEKQFGIHIASKECLEEGSSTLIEFGPDVAKLNGVQP